MRTSSKMNAKAVLTSGLLSIYCNYAIVWTTIVENLLHKNFGDTYNYKTPFEARYEP